MTNENTEIIIESATSTEQGSSSNEEPSVKCRKNAAAETNRQSDSDSFHDEDESDRAMLIQRSSSARRRQKESTSKFKTPQKRYEPEWWKTFVVLLYLLCCLFLMTVTETIVHDRVPDQNTTEPLKDIAWELTAKWPFETEYGNHVCFKLTEIIILSLVILSQLHIITHVHFSIVFRRFLFHVGTVYLYRVLTISVTILPVPKLPPGHCMPKTDGSIEQILGRAWKTLSGAGMDMAGMNMCGDYMYSGHTSIITSSALFILEYSPRRWWVYHYVVQIAATIGVFCILIAHEHYTIDIIIAYYIVSNHFWMYHTMASFPEISTSLSTRVPLARAWWWRIFRFMEVNVPGPLPIAHENPISRIHRAFTKYSTKTQPLSPI
ncbi:unnamed protein product [Oikopleura dioica]|uniref:Sphingomyelin synthase-like domain-containing protein n=2 Tax=Oikopleura dioica TaxID=34765 RepID=E4XJD2_OIKDI|nr:unnamed protein product [Oikopleura dioica]